MLYLLDLREFLSDLIEFAGILKRTDSKSRGKIIKTALRRHFGSRFQTQSVTPKTAFSTLRNCLKSPAYCVKAFRLISTDYKRNGMLCRQLPDQMLLLCGTLFLFLSRRNIGIILKYSDLKIL